MEICGTEGGCHREDHHDDILAFHATIEIDPDIPAAYLGIAEAYLGMDDIEQAIKFLDQGYQRTQDERLYDQMWDLCCGTGFPWKEIDPETGWLTESYLDANGEAFTVNEYDENGLLRRATFKVDGGFRVVDYEYDDRGLLIRETETRPDGSGSIIEHEYNEDGTLIKTTIYTKSGVVTNILEYDANGILRRETHNVFRNVIGDEIIYYHITEYDEAGLELQSVEYHADGTLYRSYIPTYGENGLLIRRDEISADGTLNSYYLYEYDENGNVIKESWFDEEGNTLPWTEYDYDSNGIQTEYRIYNADGSLQHREVTSYQG